LDGGDFVKSDRDEPCHATAEQRRMEEETLVSENERTRELVLDRELDRMH
jgi:hypothetical protein